jgi:hypothetical protein
MGHPILSFEQVRQRNEEILAYANEHPEITKTAIGLKFGLNRETIRLILGKGRSRAQRNARLAEKAAQWGFTAPK